MSGHYEAIFMKDHPGIFIGVAHVYRSSYDRNVRCVSGNSAGRPMCGHVHRSEFGAESCGLETQREMDAQR